MSARPHLPSALVSNALDQKFSHFPRPPHFLQQSSKRRIAVLQGGTSAERDVSLKSGEAIANALRISGAHVECIDPAMTPIRQVNWSRFDLAFLALHGTYGEDGQLQRELDALNVIYTGSDAHASEIAFHKHAAKVEFLKAGLPTPRYGVATSDCSPNQLAELADRIGYPVVVKPEAQGSSLGVTILQDEFGLIAACKCAFLFDHTILIEKAIAGQEWTVPVCNDQALFPIQIKPSQQFYDFEAKYHDRKTDYVVTSDLSDSVVLKLQELGLQASRTLGCTGISRVDIRVDAYGSPWLLEVNTLPGMTEQSLVPKSAAVWGWSMSDLCEVIIRSALLRSKEPTNESHH
ncbi:D-alanine--D-alanine ligase [Planctomicrobium sp. SH668]|uniref:D-alanine--D-alanine ligase n=1 Tax=Planctomicrobium sp. SH668 TaxID=3448126 RepID=UPI003F5B6F91